jgi:two-component system chemotaxis sensor kinase CheA
MIDDKELRDLFKIESAEHIQCLEKSFLHLEKDPGNRAVLEESFREAHSLKGAARMLGLADIEGMSHRIEDILGAANKGTIPLSAESLDRLYKGLDTIRRLADEAVTEGSIPTQQAAVQEPVTSVASPETREADIKDFRIETIRVETKKLDELMTQAGELSVTRLRIAQRLADIEHAITQWEEISKKIPEKNVPPAGSPSYDMQYANGESERLGSLLTSLRNALYEDNSRLDFITGEFEDSIGKIRLLPFATIFNLFPRMVRDIAKEKAKEIQLIIEGGETSADKRILEEMKDPLMHMVRNAVDHGIETPAEREQHNKPRTGIIRLKAYQSPSHIVIEVSDDGKGLDLESIKRAAVKRKLLSEEALSAMPPAQIHSLIFVSGISTSTFVSDISGRGVGLDVVRANVEHLKGTIHVESIPSRGLTLRILLPLTIATARVVIVTVKQVKYAVPVEYIQTIRHISRKEIFALEGRKTIVFDKLPVPVAHLSDILTPRYPVSLSRNPQRELFPCIILSVGDDKLGIFVDEIIDEQEIVLKPQSKILQRIKNISGSTILGTGETCMVLNPHDLIKSVRKSETVVSEEKPEEKVETKKSLLVAEDSITVRTQMKRILEGAGYEVTVAVDGLDAFNKLGGGLFDALVSDIMMPNMNGLTLTEKIRQDKKYREIPVILVTSLASDEDRKKGIEAGANAYITKSSFDQRVLLETLRRLI